MRAGLLLLHKPVGSTSAGLVRAVAAGLAGPGGPPPALCHGGALDPFAHGLLPIWLGPATRLMEELHAAPKRYVARVVWGGETDSGDAQGAVTARGDPAGLGPSRLDAALAPFLGWREQTPEPFSNLRVEGERAWVRARRGEAVALAPRPAYLHAARWLDHDLPRTSLLELTCRGGFFVRALARALGRALGCRAHLATLWRASIGPWTDPGEGGRAEVEGGAILPWLPSRDLSEEEACRAELGRPIPRGALADPAWPLPPGFPGPDPCPVLGLCGGRLRVLLRAEGALLRLQRDLGGGI